MKGELYIDWPWGLHRFLELDYHSDLTVFHYVLNKISDLPDSVFLFGTQQSYLPWFIPFPAFSNSPSFKSSEFNFPWLESFISELRIYRKMAASGNFSSEAMDLSVPHVPRHVSLPSSYVPWERKIAKAAAAVSYMPGRHLFFDQAASRPDLFAAHFTCAVCNISPVNPASPERTLNGESNLSEPSVRAPYRRKDTGYIGKILPLYNALGAEMDVGKYKYLVVMTGGFNSDNLAALTGKLAAYLAHSGAVIMLQKSEFSYHFSTRLKPWVHYVPLSYSMAELTRKVEYLVENDHLAKRLAMNARAFGDSYLRLEDYFCYVASALEGKLDL